MKFENQFQFVKSRYLDQVTVLQATMHDFSYGKHAHEEYSFGVTQAGRQDFFSSGDFHKYTPGPANLLSLNAGLYGEIKNTMRFCMGVACAMLILFLFFGYTGAWLITADSQLIIGLLGSCYIAYLAYKIARSSQHITDEISTDKVQPSTRRTGFRSGLILPLLNPKSFIAILPIVTVQFPAADISGVSILLCSLLLAGLAFGAPGSYLFMGVRLSKLISQPRYFRWLNNAMALLLLYVAIEFAFKISG